MNRQPRRGTVLILVAGISALLASLALTFLARMRSDVEESALVLQHAQAKIMLAAACNYVQEASRIGYDRYRDLGAGATPPNVGKRGDLPSYPIHEEAFGWVDVRNGENGPLDREGKPFFPDSTDPTVTRTAKWPGVGGHVRCPMYRMKIPPYAVKLTAAPNAMVSDNAASADYCYPLLRYPDPMPVENNKWSIATRMQPSHPMKPLSDTERDWMRGAYRKHADGDTAEVPGTNGRAWFRVYRDGPGTFIVTCGAGGTFGFKNWQEILSENADGTFLNQAVFESIRNSETRLWYRIEWTAAVLETSYHNLHHEVARDHEHYLTWPPNSGHTWSDTSRPTQTWTRNPVGTIRWIQRLISEPTNY